MWHMMCDMQLSNVRQSVSCQGLYALVKMHWACNCHGMLVKVIKGLQLHTAGSWRSEDPKSDACPLSSLPFRSFLPFSVLLIGCLSQGSCGTAAGDHLKLC